MPGETLEEVREGRRGAGVEGVVMGVDVELEAEWVGVGRGMEGLEFEEVGFEGVELKGPRLKGLRFDGL